MEIQTLLEKANLFIPNLYKLNNLHILEALHAMSVGWEDLGQTFFKRIR
jgi:hypothetical protein